MNRREALTAIAAGVAGSVLPTSPTDMYVSRTGDALDWSYPKDLTIQCRFFQYAEKIPGGIGFLTVCYRHKGESRYRTVTVDGRRFDFFPGVSLTILDDGFEFRVDGDDEWTLELDGYRCVMPLEN